MANRKAQELRDLLDSFRPILYINDFDFHAVDELIREAIPDRQWLVEYNNSKGEAHFETKMPRHERAPERPCSEKLAKFLDEYISDLNERPDQEIKKVLVLKDVHGEIRSPEIVARLRLIAERTMHSERYWVPVIIVSTVLTIPPELDKLITVFDMEKPSDEKIKGIIKDYADSYKFDIDKDTLRDLSLAFKGLSDFEICQILNLAYQNGGTVTKADIPLILKEKEQAIRKGGLLDADIDVMNLTKESIGGLENLKEYLGGKAIIFKNLAKALEAGVDMPKGILIVGLPGCGKSLAAKVSAKMFNVPLFRLDIGRLMGKYVGESEENLRQAIRQAEAAAPCVLWIDEIEKAFAGLGRSGGDGGITTRLFGHFLTWLQEKRSTVYVVATANDITGLPPEFLRKGRFDEIFSVKLPTDEERRQIFEIQLKKRKQNPKKLGIDIGELVRETAGEKGIPEYSGADIESIVKMAVESAFIRGEENRSSEVDKEDVSKVTQQDLLDAIHNTKPIRQTMRKKIEEQEESIKKFQIVEASKM